MVALFYSGDDLARDPNVRTVQPSAAAAGSDDGPARATPTLGEQPFLALLLFDYRSGHRLAFCCGSLSCDCAWISTFCDGAESMGTAVLSQLCDPDHDLRSAAGLERCAVVEGS